MLTAVKYWLWLTSRLDPVAAWSVFCHFGTPEKAYFSDPEEYAHIEGLSPSQQALLADKSVSFAEEILARCDRQNLRILTFQDTDYPERLRNIEIPPLVLYLRGQMLRFDDRAVIAIAGTRKATLYGHQAAYSFARELTLGGALVATGIVAGCDESAVKGALSADGPIVGVVAGGVNLPYYDTPSSRKLLDRIAAQGALVSESPPGTQHKGNLFRRRNAILTGLSVGLLCVEAGNRSGTLSVAALANEQGKDVFAIPANLGAKSSLGTNDLLRRGLACPVLAAEDILSRYSYLLPQSAAVPSNFTRWKVVRHPAQQAPAPPTPEQVPPAQQMTPEPPACAPAPASERISSQKKVDTAPDSGYIELLDASDRWSEEERALLKALLSGPATLETLIAATHLPASLVSATVTMLAVSGVVRELSGGRFQLLPEQLRERNT